jgi:hypothetical protein
MHLCGSRGVAPGEGSGVLDGLLEPHTKPGARGVIRRPGRQGGRVSGRLALASDLKEIAMEDRRRLDRED